jgi:YHS domain-containing protein
MDRDVFSRPDVIAAIEANYIPVKLNVEQHPIDARQLGITLLPTEVIMTPQGRLIDKRPGYIGPPAYVARLTGFVAAGQQQPPPGLSHAQPTYRGEAPPQYRPSTPPPNQVLPVLSPALQPPMQPAITHAAGPPPPVHTQPDPTARPADPPLIGLDGFCPVRLMDKKCWKLGDRRWGATYRGHTYLFAGPEEQKRFLSNPAFYSPVNSGNDVVLELHEGKAIAGQRRHGVFYENQVYLFASETSLETFSKRADYYAGAVARNRQATRRGVYR